MLGTLSYSIRNICLDTYYCDPATLQCDVPGEITTNDCLCGTCFDCDGGCLPLGCTPGINCTDCSPGEDACGDFKDTLASTPPCSESCLFQKDSTPPQSITVQICNHATDIKVEFQGKLCTGTFTNTGTSTTHGIYKIVKPPRTQLKKKCNANLGLNPNIVIDGTEIHTSCSQPIALGRGFGTTCTDGPIFIIGYLNDRDDPNSGATIPANFCP